MPSNKGITELLWSHLDLTNAMGRINLAEFHGVDEDLHVCQCGCGKEFVITGKPMLDGNGSPMCRECLSDTFDASKKRMPH